MPLRDLSGSEEGRPQPGEDTARSAGTLAAEMAERKGAGGMPGMQKCSAIVAFLTLPTDHAFASPNAGSVPPSTHPSIHPCICPSPSVHPFICKHFSTSHHMLGTVLSPGDAEMTFWVICSDAPAWKVSCITLLSALSSPTPRGMSQSPPVHGASVSSSHRVWGLSSSACPARLPGLPVAQALQPQWDTCLLLVTEHQP